MNLRNKLYALSFIPLTITCPHKDVSLTAELAQTPDERRQGLMYRKSLDEHSGMLFVYDDPQPVSMWMKNTLIPLDMIFADSSGRVLSIHENTVPYSLEKIGPVDDTMYVLEVKGGTSKKQDITKNCRLVYPLPE